MSPKNISGCDPEDGGNEDHWKELDRKDSKKDQDSRSAQSKEKPAPKFSSASEQAAGSVHGEDEKVGDSHAR